jgi:hypothetical protein
MPFCLNASAIAALFNRRLHNLFWLVVNGKIQRGVRAEENDDGIAREYAEANSKTSGRAGVWTRHEKTFSFMEASS